jgi:hypothetical protein
MRMLLNISKYLVGRARRRQPTGESSLKARMGRPRNSTQFYKPQNTNAGLSYHTHVGFWDDRGVVVRYADVSKIREITVSCPN